MTAKEQLNAIRDEDRAIQNAIDRVENWFDAATRSTGSMEAERVSGTGERSRVESAVYKMFGNGLALPCAEYVIRRVAELLRG